MKSIPVLKAALAAASLLSGSAHAAPSTWTPGQAVRTNAGQIKGQNSGGVSEYLGIAFAEPPVGKLRFQPPRKPTAKGDGDVIQATSYGHACMQISPRVITDDAIKKLKIPPSSAAVLTAFGFDPDHQVPQSEDCLTLNVWTKPQVGEAKKPVIFWIHGGSYAVGSSGLSAYRGRNIAEQEDVVFVSVNYRLNVFGFPGDPNSAPNLGLLDVRAAVEWVRDNIAGFGGDKDRITLMGQSAGAGMIDYYTYAYEKDPIANGFVLLSGVTHGDTWPMKQQTAATNWFTLASSLGCNGGSAAAAAVHECMMKKPSQDIEAARANISFVPTVDNTLIWPEESLPARKSAKGGYVFGSTDNEGGMLAVYTPDLVALLPIANDKIITCPVARRVSRAVRDGHPTWRYRYFGDFENMVMTETPRSGAWHGADIPAFFDTFPESAIPNSPQQIQVGKYMRSSLASFARDTTNGLNIKKGCENDNNASGWPQFGVLKPSLVRLGYKNQAGRNVALGGQYDLACLLG